jgi:hypothetical protein
MVPKALALSSAAPTDFRGRSELETYRAERYGCGGVGEQLDNKMGHARLGTVVPH